MAISPDIRTDRLLITPFGERHLTGRYLGWLNDKELMRYSEQRHRHHTLDSCREYWLSFDHSPHYFWAMEEHRNGWGHIGNLNAYVDERNRLADLGILVGESRARKKGYGLEAWQAVISFLFSERHIRKISAGAMAANHPMLQLMRSAGMVDDGIRRRHYLHHGKEEDIIHMAIFKQDKGDDIS